MGVFTEIEVRITLAEEITREKEEKAFEILHNFKEEIKKHLFKDKEFHVNELEFDSHQEDEIEIRIHSGREPNATFHVDCLIKLYQIYDIPVNSFEADIIQPNTYISLEGNEFNEHEVILN